jgi:hypothetical protein
MTGSAGLGACARPGDREPPGVAREWAVEDGFSLALDSEGYRFPSAIAFVPRPGPRPEDALYFVTELRGTVKVVTNDRTIHTFAEHILSSQPARELPDIQGETGLAGICLDPERGYVFVTFAYLDSARVLRNNIVRLQSTPGTFGTRATGRLAFTEIFSSYESAVSHQIGGCQVSEGLLYVSVADGRKVAQSQQINSVLGKILRMTLDGRPVPENPFYQDADVKRSANYVWAYGFRNPFGLRVVNGRVLVAENGSGIDRFMEVDAGENHLWNGSDWSIGANAAAVLPVVGPVQVDYAPAGTSSLPPRYRGTYFVALSAPGSAGVLSLPYSPEQRRMVRAPSQFVKYAGDGPQAVVGVGLGPDGLYFVPIMPDREGRSAIFKVAFDPAHAHPVVLDREPSALVVEYGCAGCHSIDGAGGTAAPALDRSRLAAQLEPRLGSRAYLDSLAALDRIGREPYVSYRQARSEVRQATGRDRVRAWLTYRIMEPRFDDPNAQMPALGVRATEARRLAAYLLREGDRSQSPGVLARALPAHPGPRHLLAFWGIGLLMGGAAVVTLRRLRRRSK